MPAADAGRSPILRFGAFELDPRSGELRKAGVRVALQGQPFHVLVRLLAQPGEMVTRDELRQELWPRDTFVDFEHGLNVAVKRLRDALGDSADAPRFVETLPRRGYRFIAPVGKASGPAPSERGRDAPPAVRVRARRLWWAMAGLIVGVGMFDAAIVVVPATPTRVVSGDAVLVSDFVNRTGDSVFDDTLRDGLTVALGQSPSFTIVSRERVRDALRQMTRSPDDPVVGAIAREVCQRTGAKVVVNGSIASLGSHYAVGLDAVDCLSGDPVGSEQVEVTRRERILEALGSSAARLRRRLGESLPSIQRFHAPLDQATTPSLDALKAFVVGRETFLRSGDAASASLMLNRAVELDPSFATAYAWLSAVSASLGRWDDEIRYARAAYSLRQKVDEQDRFYIDNRYCVVQYAPGDRTDCVMRIAELWKRTYPGAWLPYGNLAAGYLSRGQYERALENGLEATRLNPEEGSNLLIVIEAYMGLNRFEEARQMADEALTRHLVEDWVHAERFRLAFVAGDLVAMDGERRAVAGRKVEGLVLEDDADTAAFLGRMAQAHRLRRQAAPGTGGVAAEGVRARNLMVDAAVGLPVAIPQLSNTTPAFLRETYAIAALLAGNVRQAEVLLARGATRPDRRALVSAALALAAVQKGDRSAVEGLSERAPRWLDQSTRFAPPYLRGLAYLRAGDGARAAAEFQTILDHRGVDPTSPLYPLARLQRARAAALSGDAEAARRGYDTFLELWEDADPDVPVLKEARVERARLVAAKR